MRPTSRLLSVAGNTKLRITLFTRPNCSLCRDATQVLYQVHSKRAFDFTNCDISSPSNRPWRDLYDFDVPVIHISNADLPPEQPGGASEAVKFMHRLDAEQVLAKMEKLHLARME